MRVNLHRVHFTKELLDTVPREIAEQYSVLPVYVRKGRAKKRAAPEPSVLYIAAARPDDAGAVEDCELCSNMKVRVFATDREELLRAIPLVYAGEPLDAPSSQAHTVPATPNRMPPPPPLPPPPPTRPPARSGNFPELPLIRAAAPRAAEAAPVVSEVPATPPTPPMPTPPTPQKLVPPETLAQAVPPSLEAQPTARLARLSEPAAAPGPPDELDTPIAPGVAPLEAGAHAPSVAPASRPQTQRSNVEDEGPLRLVVVGGLAGWLEFCRDAVASLGAQVESCEMGRTQILTTGPKPHLLLVPEEIYPFDRRAFNLLGFQLGVPVVVWSLDMDPSDLQLLLLAAKASRASTSINPPASAPSPASAQALS